MSSLFGHSLAGLTFAALSTAEGPPRPKVAAFAVACALAPDLDWFSPWTALAGLESFAHRGLSHSLLAALALAALAMLLGFRRQLRSPRLWACMTGAALSHGLLDACTFGGTGVAFLLPFSDARFVCQWQPLFVSPIPLTGRLWEWLLLSLGSEVVWIGLPALALLAGKWALRRVGYRLRLDP